MTTAIAPTPDATGTVPIRPQRFSTLVGVEVRKQTDTRSGLALLGVTVGSPGSVAGRRRACQFARRHGSPSGLL